MKKWIWICVGMLFLFGCGQPSSNQSQPQESSLPKVQTSPAAQKDIAEGIQHLKNSDLAGAIKSFDDAIRQNPLDPKPYMILGQMYMRLKNYPRARQVFSAAARIAPDNGEIYYFLAINTGLAGDKAQAKVYAEKSVSIFQKQQDQKNFIRALALLRGLMKSGPDSATQVDPPHPAPASTASK